jgi:hypothetical protein
MSDGYQLPIPTTCSLAKLCVGGTYQTHSGSRKADSVVALLRIDGHEFIEQNGWIRKAGMTMQSVLDFLGSKGVTPNAISPTHAEGGVLYQALKSGRNFAGKKAEIFVDAMFCDPCGKNNGLSQ